MNLSGAFLKQGQNGTSFASGRAGGLSGTLAARRAAAAAARTGAAAGTAIHRQSAVDIPTCRIDAV